MSQIEDVCEQAKQQGALATRAAAGAQGGRGRKASNNVTSFTRGNDATYLARRLLRDAPDIFAALERGEYPSVRAAAKAAGLVRDKTPLEQLHYWWGKASAREQEPFRAAVAYTRGVHVPCVASVTRHTPRPVAHWRIGAQINCANWRSFT